MTKTTTKTRGKYSVVVNRPVRCLGCGTLCANYTSLKDHQSDCNANKNRHELTQVRGIEDIRGDLRRLQ